MIKRKKQLPAAVCHNWSLSGMNFFSADGEKRNCLLLLPKLILGIVGLKFINMVNGQTYVLKESGAVGWWGVLWVEKYPDDGIFYLSQI